MQLQVDKEKKELKPHGSYGFPVPGYFSRIFKRKMGLTPLEYRKSRREQENGQRC